MTPAPIKPAATVVVLRDGASGPEVFMVRRTFTIAFMAGAHVFPGGRVDGRDEDASSAWCDGLKAGASEPAPAFVVSAARELFEEAGLLLARDIAGQTVTINEESRPRFDEYRRAIHGGEQTFRQVIEREQLRLSLDSLVPFAHWVTPPLETRRFDTWFFLAAAPAGQVPEHDGGESVESVWLRPSDALAQCMAGAINLPPPTWATLRELERFESAADALAWAAARTIHERSPLMVEEAGGRVLFLPGHERHRSTEQVAFETRFVLRDGRWLPG